MAAWTDRNAAGWKERRAGRHDTTTTEYKGEILIRKTVAIAGLLALVFGFILGSLIPAGLLPWSVERYEDQIQVNRTAVPVESDTSGNDGSDRSGGQDAVTGADSGFHPRENFPLLNTACAVLREIQERDYKALAAYVDTEQGLTFTTFSTVNREIDLTFTADQVAAFGKDDTKYNWGIVPGSGQRLNLMPSEYFSAYMFNVDYTQAAQIGVDKVNISGNALENVTQAYPGCRFVEFTYPGTGTSGQSQDWCALKLVFTPGPNRWRLVGLIHSQWIA